MLPESNSNGRARRYVAIALAAALGLAGWVAVRAGPAAAGAAAPNQATETPIPTSLPPVDTPTPPPTGQPPVDTPTPPPTGLPPVDTPTPLPTALPPTGNVCPHILRFNKVPLAAINAAVANPRAVRGYNQPRDEGKPVGPYNPPRLWLSLHAYSKPYHPFFNSLEYKVGCP